MSTLTEKFLKSGLVDKATAEILERWGALPDGASDLTQKEELKNATHAQLVKFAEDIGDEVEKNRRLKETMLDLNQLRWPTMVAIYDDSTSEKPIASPVDALIDRMGRYYFRAQDVKRGWFVPGYRLTRNKVESGHEIDMINETILEVTELFIGEEVAAIQVSTE